MTSLGRCLATSVEMVEERRDGGGEGRDTDKSEAYDDRVELS